MNIEEQTGNVVVEVANGNIVMESQAAGSAELPAVIREIDTYIGQTFDAMTEIDKAYGKVSDFFMEQAEKIAGERDFEKLSDAEQKASMAFLGAALAVEGLSAVTRGIKETMALENVKRLHRKVATERIESLPRMIERAERCHNEAAEILSRHNGELFSKKKLKETFEGTAGLLEAELCQFRDLRFRLDMLLWLKDEYEAWLDDRLYSDTPMPTTGMATVAAIYVAYGEPMPVSREKHKKDMVRYGQNVLEAFNNTGNDSFTAFQILAVIDDQIMAVLEHASQDKDPLAVARVKGGDGEEEYDMDKLSVKCLYAYIYSSSGVVDMPPVDEALNNSPVVGNSCSFYKSFGKIMDDYNRGSMLTVVSGLIIAAAAIMPIWNLGWKWYWATALSVVALLMVVKWFIASPSKKIEERTRTKFEMMSINYEYRLAKNAGMIEPKSRVKEMAKSRNDFWTGLIIGGLLGSIFFPIGTIIGAVVGAILGSSSFDSDSHGNGWEAIRIYKPAKQWIKIVILGLFLAFEVYALFIK